MNARYIQLVVVTLGIAACAADTRPDVAGESTVVPPPASSCTQGCTNSLPNGDGGTDGGDDEPIGPALCDGLTQESQSVVKYETIFPPDAAKGGVLAPGLYVLHSVESYVAAQQGRPDDPPVRPTNALVKATLIVTRKTMRWIRATGTDDGQDGQFAPAEIHADTYVLDGTTIASTTVCPAAGTKTSVSYSVSGNLLTLRLSDTDSETYLLKTF